MKFVRRDLGEAAEASNAGAEGMRREIVWLLTATAILFAGLYLSVGYAVELLLPHISVARERAWFAHLSLAGRELVPANPEESARLARAREVLGPLTRQSGVPPLDYRLVLLEGSGPNAFAFPGGTIGVTRELLALCDEEVSLAFVLGHELGHFKHRDHLRGLGRALGRSLVWGLVSGEGGDVLTQRAGVLLDLSHSRRTESGADRFGLELVLAVYGRTEGADRLFAWLESRQKQPSWVQWMQTHPNPGQRIRDLRAWAAAPLSAAH